MLNVVDTGDLTYVYVAEKGNIISAIPMHLKTSVKSVKNFNLSEAYAGSKRSPKFKAMTARNAKLFNRNNYLSNNEYTKVIRKLLEVLPGNKSMLFFGGDFTSTAELLTVIKVAGEIQFKTWTIASSDRSLLNNAWINMMCEDVALPDNVWLYELETCEETEECVLHDYPTLMYTPVEETEGPELLQFPEEYKSFSIKVCQ
jgi:hypothetical protein